jgi:hypothetical protein
MTTGEMLYLVLVLVAFAGFALTLAVESHAEGRTPAKD